MVNILCHVTIFASKETQLIVMDLGANISEAQREPGVNVNATKMRNNFGSTNAPDGLSSDLRAIKLTLYVVIFLVSVLGNSLVCTVILRRKKDEDSYQLLYIEFIYC